MESSRRNRLRHSLHPVQVSELRTRSQPHASKPTIRRNIPSHARTDSPNCNFCIMTSRLGSPDFPRAAATSLVRRLFGPATRKHRTRAGRLPARPVVTTSHDSWSRLASRDVTRHERKTQRHVTASRRRVTVAECCHHNVLQGTRRDGVTTDEWVQPTLLHGQSPSSAHMDATHSR